MTRLETQRLLPQTAVKLRSPPNWTAVCFFAGLAALHLYIATTAMLNQRWEGFMSWIFGIAFAGIALMCWRLGTEITVCAADGKLRVRTGFRRFYFERVIPFTKIRDVRLTLYHPRRPREAKIELVCDHDVIECPPTNVPREEALCLAMTMGVQLTKIYSEAFGPAAQRLDQLPPE
jgi:hypothetical protein